MKTYDMRFHTAKCCKHGEFAHDPTGLRMFMTDKPYRVITEAKRICNLVQTNVYVNWNAKDKGFVVSYPSLEVSNWRN